MYFHLTIHLFFYVVLWNKNTLVNLKGFEVILI